MNHIVLLEDGVDTIGYVGALVSTAQHPEIYKDLSQRPVVIDEMPRDGSVRAVVRRRPEIDGQRDLGSDRSKVFLQRRWLTIP